MLEDNVVLVQTPDSAATALRKLATVFVSQGYTVEKLDREFLTLTLAPKTLNGAFSPILLARASATPGPNSALRLMGDFKAVVLGHNVNDAAKVYGTEKGISINSFRAIEKAALAYPAGQVSYGRQ